MALLTPRPRLLRLMVLAAALGAASGLAGGPLSEAAAPDPRSPRYRLIVNLANPVRALPRRLVSRIFLKRATRWPDGRPATPVDLADTQAAREEFSRHVHHKAVRTVKAYWQQMLFSGRGAPPPELAREEDVIALVRAERDAVGYVSDEAPLSGVRILDVIEDEAGQR